MANASLRADERVGTTTPALVPVFTGTLDAQSVQLCDARTLHAFMQVKRDFNTWIKGRIRKFGFVEGVDYLLAKSGGQVFPKSGENLGGRPTVEYHLTLDMAKELSMVENNPLGREARRHFIACERQVFEALATVPGRPALDYARITPTQAAPDSIDVRALLLSGQSEPVPLTPAQQALINARAWVLAGEAYELARQHLERRVAYQAVTGTPRRVNVARAEQVISEGTLGTALAHEYHTQIEQLLSTARVFKQLAGNTFDALQALAAKQAGQGSAVNSLK